MKNCTCRSCEWRNRWELRYQQFLKDNPTKDAKKFIAGMRKTDRSTLICLADDKAKWQAEHNWGDYENIPA